MRRLTVVLLITWGLVLSGCGEKEPSAVSSGPAMISLTGKIEKTPHGYELRLDRPRQFLGNDICDSEIRQTVWLAVGKRINEGDIGPTVDVTGKLDCPKGGWILSVDNIYPRSGQVAEKKAVGVGTVQVETKSKQSEQDASATEFRLLGDQHDGSRHFYLAPRTIEKHDGSAGVWLLSNEVAPQVVEGKSFSSYLMKIFIDCEDQEAWTGVATYWKEKNASGALISRSEGSTSRFPVERGTILNGVRHVICQPWSEGQKFLDKMDKAYGPQGWPMRIKIPSDRLSIPTRAASDKGGPGGKPTSPQVSGASPMMQSRVKAAGAMSDWADLITRLESRSPYCQELARTYAKNFINAHDRFQRADQLQGKIPPGQVAVMYDQIEFTARAFMKQAKSFSPPCNQ